MTDKDKLTIKFEDFGWFSAVPVESNVNQDFLRGLVYEHGLGVAKDAEGREIDLNKAAEFYRKAANKDDGRAQFCLGVLYALGRGVDHDEKLARKLFDKAEKSVKPCILTLIAEIYFLGRGVETDKEKAKLLWKKADELGCPNAKSFMERYLGIGYDKFEVSAPEELLPLAEAGDIEAQFRLGDYYYGKRGKKNAKMAFEWLKKAAEEGHARALYKLSGVISSCQYVACVPYICCLMDIYATLFGCANAPNYVANHYKWGWGIVKSDSLNVEYIKLSAAMGDPDGKCELGLLYSRGNTSVIPPIEADPVKAAKLLKEALDEGVADARYPYNQLMKQLTPEQKSMLSPEENPPTEKLTKATLKKLCKEGVRYLYGDGVEKDWDVAEEYLFKAAKHGFAEAQYYLGKLFADIFETSIDSADDEEYLKLCAEWYEKAAEQGHSEAQYETGMCYLNGEGVEENEEKAIFWLKKSADNGNADAMEFLKENNF